MWQVLAPFVARDAEVRSLGKGWDCDALAVGGRIVIKQPRHAEAAERLRREAGLLALVRPRVGLPVPRLNLVEGAGLWSWHEMLPGEPLSAQGYAALPEAARAGLARDLARFLAEVHQIPLVEARAAGALDVPPWGSVGEVAALLPEGLRAAAKGLCAAYDALPPDPLGQVLGQFDGHGWNMAFDATRQRLNGMFDFGDGGIGPLHRDFVYAGLTSLDLMDRLVMAYQAERGVALDRARIAVLAGRHRLWELAESGGEADYVARFRDWHDWHGG